MTKRTPRGPIEQGRDTRMRLTLLERRIARRRPVGTSLIEDGAVTTPKLADGAVTTPKIADGAVVPGKIALRWLTDENLDDVTETGSYVQIYNNQATSARNYPSGRAGFLEVLNSDRGYGVGIIQRYTDYQNADNVWSRSWYDSWGPWTGGDTGWVDLSSYLSSGIGGTFQGKITADTVWLRAAGINESVPSGDATTATFSGLPAEYRPDDTWLGPAQRAGYSGFLVVRADGTGGFRQRSGVSWAGVSGSNISYPKG